MNRNSASARSPRWTGRSSRSRSWPSRTDSTASRRRRARRTSIPPRRSKRIARRRAPVRATGAAILAYGSYLGRPEVAARDHAPSARCASRKRSARRASASGRRRSRARPTRGFAEVASLLRAACDAAAAGGIDVVVERHAGSFADTPERIERLFAAVDRAELRAQLPGARPAAAIARRRRSPTTRAGWFRSRATTT